MEGALVDKGRTQNGVQATTAFVSRAQADELRILSSSDSSPALNLHIIRTWVALPFSLRDARESLELRAVIVALKRRNPVSLVWRVADCQYHKLWSDDGMDSTVLGMHVTSDTHREMQLLVGMVNSRLLVEMALTGHVFIISDCGVSPKSLH